jgi:hypothetical protein
MATFNGGAYSTCKRLTIAIGHFWKLVNQPLFEVSDNITSKQHCVPPHPKEMIPEGIEPSIFGTGIRRVAIAPWNHLLECWSPYEVLPCAGWLVGVFDSKHHSKKGAIRESNPRPPAPKAGIIPLDQSPDSLTKNCTLWDSNPRPQRGSELESDALTNSAKGALLSVNPPL